MPPAASSSKLVEFVAAEGLAFGGGLDFDEAAAAGHDHVHIDFGARIFFVAEIEQRARRRRGRRWWRRRNR